MRDRRVSPLPDNFLMRTRNQIFQQSGNKQPRRATSQFPGNTDEPSWYRRLLSYFSRGPKEMPAAPAVELFGYQNNGDSSVQVKVKETGVSTLPKLSVTSTNSNQTRHLLEEEQAYDVLGFAYSPLWKYGILAVVFFVQLSMNFNAAVYPNAFSGMREEFGITNDYILELGMGLFLICYAFGCELWAPWSEELGRFWILQASLFLVNVWQFFGMFGKNYYLIVVGRILGGLSSAGGSVTIGMVADLFEPDEHQFATLFVVLASCGGSVLGPIFGSLIEANLHWRWIFHVQLIVGVVAQLAHFLLVPETRATILLDREAKRRRREGINPNIWGPNEIKGTFWQRISIKHCLEIMWRPYQFLIFEPIVRFLSLLSGFSDALIFLGLYSFGIVLEKWDFTTVQVGLSFISLLAGYACAYAYFIPFYIRDQAAMKRAGGLKGIVPERRLKALVICVLLEPIGLGLFAAASYGPPIFTWHSILVAAFLIGIANFAIYQASIDYMIAAYGGHAASATGGNGFCRDFLAGVAAFIGKPLYGAFMPGTNYQLVIPTAILAIVSLGLCFPVFLFYFNGAKYRERSPFAVALDNARAEKQTDRIAAIQETRGNTPAVSPEQSRTASPDQSRAPSLEVSLESWGSDSSSKHHDASPAISPIASRKNSIAIYKTRSATAPSSATPSRQPTIRLTTKGMSKDGKLGSSRIVDEVGEEIVLAAKTSERKGRSMAVPASPSEDLSRVRSNSDTAVAMQQVEGQFPSPLDAHLQDEQTLVGAFDAAVRRTKSPLYRQ